MCRGSWPIQRSTWVVSPGSILTSKRASRYPRCRVLQDVHPRGQGGEQEVPSGVRLTRPRLIPSMTTVAQGTGSPVSESTTCPASAPVAAACRGPAARYSAEGNRAENQPSLAILVVIFVGVGVLGARPPSSTWISISLETKSAWLLWFSLTTRWSALPQAGRCGRPRGRPPRGARLRRWSSSPISQSRPYPSSASGVNSSPSSARKRTDSRGCFQTVPDFDFAFLPRRFPGGRAPRRC